MADITITVPDGTPPRIVDAIASEMDYDTTKREDETKAQFAERMTKVWWREIVRRAEDRAAADVAAADPNDPLNVPE